MPLAQKDRYNRTDSHISVNETELRILVLGDTGESNEQQAHVVQSSVCPERGLSPHLALLLGDIIYDVGAESPFCPLFRSCFENVFGSFQIPCYVTLGNHDYGNGEVERDPAIYSQYATNEEESSWVHPARYFHFVYELFDTVIEFFALDTVNFCQEQKEWLSSHLQSDPRVARGLSEKSLWRVAFGHHPVFSFGAHGDTPGLSGELHMLFKDKVDIYLCGHEHDQQIIQCKDRPLYVVSGTVARLRQEFYGESSDGHERRTLFADSRPGFVSLNISREKLRLSVHTTESLQPAYTQTLANEKPGHTPEMRKLEVPFLRKTLPK